MKMMENETASLLCKHKHRQVKNELICLSDKMSFCLTQKTIIRVDCWLCPDFLDTWVISTKFSATVMVIGVISGESDNMPPFFFRKGLIVDTYSYICVTDKLIKQWIEGLSWDCEYIF